MTIWDFQALVTRRLLLWGTLSAITGAAMLRYRPFWRGFGVQALTWGVIDCAIAMGGNWFRVRRYHHLANPLDLDIIAQETSNLQRALWINAALDIFYVMGGLALVRREDAAARGHGLGIVVQGAFLLIFDVIHALRLPK